MQRLPDLTLVSATASHPQNQQKASVATLGSRLLTRCLSPHWPQDMFPSTNGRVLAPPGGASVTEVKLFEPHGDARRALSLHYAALALCSAGTCTLAEVCAITPAHWSSRPAHDWGRLGQHLTVLAPLMADT